VAGVEFEDRLLLRRIEVQSEQAHVVQESIEHVVSIDLTRRQSVGEISERRFAGGDFEGRLLLRHASGV